MTFRRAVWLSVILHVGLAVVSVTRTFLSPGEPMQLPDAIRVDIVGLPQKMAPDEPLPPEPAAAPAPAPPAPPPKAEVAPPPPPPPPKPEAPKFVEKPKPTKPVVDVKKSQKNALNHLKELDAFAKLEKAAAERKAAEAAEANARARADAKAKAALIAGHQVTKGNSLTGISRLDYDRYGAELKARVLGNWAVPAWLAEADYSARVRVWLDDSGRVTKKQIIKSSGDETFDAAALEAVDKSDPFPAPPENLRGVLSAEGFTLGLPK